jgi:hypothetical protein
VLVVAVQLVRFAGTNKQREINQHRPAAPATAAAAAREETLVGRPHRLVGAWHFNSFHHSSAKGDTKLSVEESYHFIGIS